MIASRSSFVLVAPLMIVSSLEAAVQSSAATATEVTQQTADSRIDAAAAQSRLQDARNTISRLTEHSMSQDARVVFGRLTKQVDNLHNQYGKTQGWRAAYEEAEQSLTTLIGPPAKSGAPGAVVENGASGGELPGIPGIPVAVRADFQLLRSQLDQFWTAATGESAHRAQPAGQRAQDRK